MKFKPIQVYPTLIAQYRAKLLELARRLARDYELQLKPLILKMSEEQQKKLSKAQVQENAKLTFKQATDAVRYLTAYEVARMVGVLKKQVIRDISTGKIKGAIHEGENWLITEQSVRPYGVLIGKFEADQTLLEKFNHRLEKLRRKYQDLLYAYEATAKDITLQTYKESKRKFYAQFKKAAGIDLMTIMTEKGLKDAFDAQVKENVNLISSIPKKYFDDIQTLVKDNVNGVKVPEGGMIQALMDLTKATKTKAKLIARDQTAKAFSDFNHLRMQNCGVQGYCWRNSRDRRVAGNPNGLYPDVDKNSKYHGNHWDREGQYFLFQKMAKPPIAPDGKPFRQPPPDGPPGKPILCRCFADPVIPDFDTL